MSSKDKSLETRLNKDEKPLTFSQAAQYLGISKSYLYKLTCKHKITHYKPNNKMLYFLESDLQDYILRNRRKTENELERQADDFIQERSNL
jgi:excisionase family DNA binding protein